MASPLTQITFDFAPAEESEQTSTAPAAQVTEKKPEEATVKIVNETKPKPQNPFSIAGKRGRKSLKEIDQNADLIQIPEDEILFNWGSGCHVQGEPIADPVLGNRI